MVNNNSATAGEQVGLISYLAKLGLGDADLARVFSMMQPSPAETAPPTSRARRRDWAELNFSFSSRPDPRYRPR